MTKLDTIMKRFKALLIEETVKALENECRIDDIMRNIERDLGEDAAVAVAFGCIIGLLNTKLEDILPDDIEIRLVKLVKEVLDND